MPWSKLTDTQLIRVYKDALLELFDVRERDMNLTMKELMTRSEILKHDFTKRQLSILMFIFTFSFAFGKDKAYIPKLQDFALTGVSPTKIKSELNKLIKMNVIVWDQEENTFSIKNTKSWEVPYNSGFSDARGKELYMLNLEHAGVDIVNLMKKIKNMV